MERSFSVGCAAGALTLAALPPAHADAPWFAAYVSSSIPNGLGPGPAPRGTAAADLTGDGVLDVVTVSDFTQGDLLLAPGAGDGTFGAPSEIAGTSGTQGLDVGDLDGDGDADVVAMTTSGVRLTGLGSEGEPGDLEARVAAEAAGHGAPVVTDVRDQGVELLARRRGAGVPGHDWPPCVRGARR